MVLDGPEQWRRSATRARSVPSASWSPRARRTRPPICARWTATTWCSRSGPAGTGKTYLAVAMAVALLKQRRIERIILSRPAVEAGERLGFLPGDLKEKVDPYMRPLYDALQDMMPEGKLQQRIDDRPDRDRTAGLHARPNTEQRLRHPGRGAEHHALADEDVPHPHGRELPYDRHRRSDADRSAAGHAVRAIGDAVRKLGGLAAVSVVQFDNKDVVRHPLVGAIIEAYEMAARQAVQPA